MKRDTLKSAKQIKDLNKKLNKQETMVTKVMGVEREMVSLRSQILIKDSEISTLKVQLKKSGGAIPEESSDLEESFDSSTEV